MNLKEMLIKENIVKIKNKDEEPFTLKSGKKSRLFIDVKEASLNPEILNTIKWEFLKIHGFELDPQGLFMKYERIGSVAVGGIPVATIISYFSKVPQIIVRSEKHDRGTQSQIIGNCKDKRVLLIEDVATSGGSIINAVRVIRETGGICNDCIVVVDREEGAKEWCLQNDINLYPLLKKSDFGINEEMWLKWNL